MENPTLIADARKIRKARKARKWGWKVKTGDGKRSSIESLNRLRKENETMEEESRNKWGERPS